MKDTVILPIDPERVKNGEYSEADTKNIETAAEILKNGGNVVIPTETVYGLAADAMNTQAVNNIFIAKGRPQDNPLIVHISSLDMLDNLLASPMPENAKRLAEKYWPGPLTMVFPKSGNVPSETSGGLDTVAVRFPSHPVAQAIIAKADLPLAAPSANLSGKPSTTTAQHCMDDLTGRVDAIVDGGSCGFGLESTVLSFAEKKPIVLRPGGITVEMIREIIGDVDIHHAVTSQLESYEKATSPGMKYKHYAPKGDMILIDGDEKQFADYVNSHSDENTYAMCFDEDIKNLKIKYVSYGSVNDAYEQAEKLFDVLRGFDDIGAKTIYAHCPKLTGMGLAVYNRMVRAAANRIIRM